MRPSFPGLQHYWHTCHNYLELGKVGLAGRQQTGTVFSRCQCPIQGRLLVPRVQHRNRNVELTLRASNTFTLSIHQRVFYGKAELLRGFFSLLVELNQGALA